MKRAEAIVLCVLASLSFDAQARKANENTSYGYAQVTRVEPVVAMRRVETLDPDCLRPAGPRGVVKVPTGCAPKPVVVRTVVAYDVEYAYTGETYMSRLDHDPGSRLRVRVSITPDEDAPPETVAPPETH
jgi:uncharacterized protein YcfJ